MRRRGTPDGPAIDWDRIADGRVHRLRRGRHYEGSDRAVLSSARAAASRLGMVVSMAREDFGATAGYVWIQFADAEVAFGDPCPRCGSMTLLREHPGYASCPQCAARLVLLVDDDPGVVLDGSVAAGAPAAAIEAPAVPADQIAPEPGAAVRVARVSQPAPAQRVARQLAQVHDLPDTKSTARLEFYEEIRLRVGSSPVGNSAFYGFGHARGVKPTFLYVEFFPAPEQDGLGDHRVTAVAARPYLDAIDFAALDDWAQFEIRPLTAADEGELTAIHPYYSLNEQTGIYVIPVAGETQVGDTATAPAS